MLKRLKEKWGVKNTFQFILIMLVFACTGFSILFAKPIVFNLLGVQPDLPFWQSALIWLLTVFPLYYLFLYIYAIIFGQRVFFTMFLKNSFGRLFPKKSTSED